MKTLKGLSSLPKIAQGPDVKAGDVVLDHAARHYHAGQSTLCKSSEYTTDGSV